MHWSPGSHVPAPPHVESAKDSPPALPFGPHVDAHVAADCWQIREQVRNPVKSVVHAVRNAPGARHEPLPQIWLPVHPVHAAPPPPHWLVVVPA